MKSHCLGVLLIALSVIRASAGLLGVSVTGCTNSVYAGAVTTNPNACDSQAAGFNTAAVIGAGVELAVTGGAGSRSIDFTDATVSVFYGRNQTSASPDLYVFTGLPAGIRGLTRLTTDPLAIQTAFSSTAIAFLVSDPLCCVFEDITVTYSVDYGSVPPDTGGPSVPAPASFWLAAGAAAAFAAFRIRR